MRNKGKVHPFSSSFSSPVSNNNESVLINLLPAAILTLVSVLSPEERHVLAYMITRSLKSTTPSTKQSGIDSHAALFDCDCFHCYTTFWFRWDSSPNRELIHQAIEAFEDHLSNGGDHHQFKKNVKRKDKSGRRRELDQKKRAAGGGVPPEENHDRHNNNVGPLESQVGVAKAEMEVGAAPPPPVVNNHNHKGLARKMLPDVMGIFNSRLWRLWSPNV